MPMVKLQSASMMGEEVLMAAFFYDGVVKSPISCVAAGSPNARHTTCTPPLCRHDYALYIKLLYVAISGAHLGFYESILCGSPKKTGFQPTLTLCNNPKLSCNVRLCNFFGFRREHLAKAIFSARFWQKVRVTSLW
jgi:hypothetical protein